MSGAFHSQAVEEGALAIAIVANHYLWTVFGEAWMRGSGDRTGELFSNVDGAAVSARSSLPRSS